MNLHKKSYLCGIRDASNALLILAKDFQDSGNINTAKIIHILAKSMLRTVLDMCEKESKEKDSAVWN